MPNLHELENAMPVAPLKIIALPSAEKMGRRINDYMVEFRKSIHNDKVKNDPAFHGYIESNYLVDVDVPVSYTHLALKKPAPFSKGRA